MTQPAQPERTHIPELQLVRALAILGVLTVHASATATITMKESAYYYFYNLINTVMRFGTPTFILLSSFVLFYSYYSRPLNGKLIAGFYKKRLLYILIPYVVFSAIYFAYVKDLTGVPIWSLESLGEFMSKLLMGEVYAHLYFVFISIQFYLLFPIVLWAAKRWKNLALWFVPLGFVLQWTFVLLNLHYWQLPNKGSWAPTYFSLFFLGATLGIYYPKIKGWLAMTRDNLNVGRAVMWLLVWGAWIAASAVHVTVWYNARLYGTIYPAELYEILWNAQAVLAALVLLHAAFFIYRHLPAGLSAMLYRLGQLSFGIYLVHLLYQAWFERLLPAPTSASALHLYYLASWVIMLTASWLTVSLISRFVPFAWILFGKVPAAQKLQRSGAKASVPAGKRTVAG
ncbi:acyltransferase [Paenibacillus agaridevorans]|uniref:acyltransferase n=1 Tax=Paenibacillus agaridevorans TaxID=171404 RepID=UPI001BE4176C|nr:acyltransferase [Paenibacillus agaridevorans]